MEAAGAPRADAGFVRADSVALSYLVDSQHLPKVGPCIIYGHEDGPKGKLFVGGLTP